MSSGQELLQSFKASAGTNESGLSIRVGVGEGILRPAPTSRERLNSGDVRVLTEWRNRYVKSFLTEFEATEERTAKWLTEVVGPDPSRILFMLDDANGQTIGYLGLAFIDWDARTGEADAIVRGVSGRPGIMTKALLALLGWAHRELGLTVGLNVRVRSDNPRAVEFYSRLATETRRVPLRETEEPGMKRWIEDESLSSSSAELIYLRFKRELYSPQK